MINITFRQIRTAPTKHVRDAARYWYSGDDIRSSVGWRFQKERHNEGVVPYREPPKTLPLGELSPQATERVQ